MQEIFSTPLFPPWMFGVRREQWKNKAVKAQKELKELQNKLNDADKKISRLEEKVNSKKNFTN